MNAKQLDILKHLTKISWPLNRRWVNMGVKIVDKHYDDIDEIISKYPEIESTIKSLKIKVDAKRERASNKSKMDSVLSSTDVKKLVSELWEEIKDVVEKNSKKYMEFVKQEIIERADVYEKYQNMSRKEQDRVYPGGFYNTRGTQKYADAYKLLQDDSGLKVALEKRRVGYIDSEKAKLEKLVFRTVEKLGDITNYKIDSYNNSNLGIVVDTPDEKDIKVTLNVTPAGGYNIQRFHYRWLSSFTKDGKSYKLKP